jgi:hypothetical protein
LIAFALVAPLATERMVVAARADDGPRVEPSGFLGDYSDLEPSPDRKDILVYRLRPRVLADYDRFIVDQPLIYFPVDGGPRGVDPADLKMLSDDLRDKLVAAIEEGGRYTVVAEPGPGVAHARIAITDAVPVDPGKNIGAKAAGVALGVGLLIPRVDLGRAAIEAEILDSLSGERLVAVVAAKESRRYGGLIKGSKEWGDARAAFKKWAKQFRKKLDQAHSD